MEPGSYQLSFSVFAAAAVAIVIIVAVLVKIFIRKAA
jgi:hypothetical protein